MKNKKKETVYRTRNFACVVYKDSAPKDWQSILADQCVPCFVSPYHDSDINPTGEPKKPHWHVMLMFDNVKTREQAIEIFNKINGVGCEYINSLRGYARYLCHLDNPDKHLYSTEDVLSFSGVDYISIIGLVTDKYKTICEIMDFCDKYHVTSYQKLLQYCRVKRTDWFRTLCDNGTYVVLEYIKSSYWEEKNSDKGSSSMPINWWDNIVEEF